MNEKELGRLVLHGTFGNIFLPKSQDQIDCCLLFAWDVKVEFLESLILAAYYEQQHPYSIPYSSMVLAVLLSVLYQRDPRIFSWVFPRVAYPNLVRAYALVSRKGIAGKKVNLSNRLHRRLLQNWFDGLNVENVIVDSSGPDFSLLDALRCSHVKGNTPDHKLFLDHRHDRKYNKHFSYLEEHEGIMTIAESPFERDLGIYEHFMKVGKIDEYENIALEIPRLGRTAIMIDVSYTMTMPIKKGSRRRCNEIAGLMGAVLARKNSGMVIPFNTEIVPLDLNLQDTIQTNATKMISMNSGGTDLSVVFNWLNEKTQLDSIIILSDDQSSIQKDDIRDRWYMLKKKQPSLKLYCVDFAPDPKTTIREYDDVFYFKGFSDQGFSAMRHFAKEENILDNIDSLVKND